VDNISSKRYPLSRPLYMYTDGKPKGDIKTFIDFVLSKDGEEQIKKAGFVPLFLNASKH